nr:MAG TPA: hypothetical protein [Caudoviricetes sp.]
MLEELMRECRNYFLIPGGVHPDTYTIKDGSIALPFLRVGQYFRIVGSTFNDGVYQYEDFTLVDETFTGAVWVLAVPQEFERLAENIQKWRTEYEDTQNSPFQSESFGGYSYSLKSDSGSYGSSLVGWRRTFANDIRKWRKL